jgi:hypothetical protein
MQHGAALALAGGLLPCPAAGCVPLGELPCLRGFPRPLAYLQYASLQKKLEPVANTVKRVGTSVTTGMVSTMNKFELTPTPAKKKNA